MDAPIPAAIICYNLALDDVEALRLIVRSYGNISLELATHQIMEKLIEKIHLLAAQGELWDPADGVPTPKILVPELRRKLGFESKSAYDAVTVRPSTCYVLNYRAT
jgi:hypothetical protein